ncbi:MAG TPA: arylsulfatase [Gemmataceae bacterium]|nr:arylsulfatase [Gemmataceae bacterium]
MSALHRNFPFSLQRGAWYCTLALLGTAFLSVFCPRKAPAVEKPNKPNLVLILADDLGYGDPHCYNKDSKIPTPNLDRLAAQSIRFTDAHTPCAVCTPTRYGLLTGRYCWRTSLKRGVLNGYSPLLIEPKRVTLASLLKQHGYVTDGFGKWHLGLGDADKTDFGKRLRPGPCSVGFDSYFGIPASLDMPPYVFIDNERVTEAPSETIKDSAMRRKGGAGFWRGGAIAPHFKHVDVLPAITEKAIGFVRSGTVQNNPFFLYLALTGPHTPWMPTAEFRGKSKAGYYGDFVAQVDAGVGRLLQALDDGKLSDNTLVIFTSDNGAHWLPEDIEKWGHRANGGLRGQKADIWEGGHRVPFLARWPGRIAAGSTSKELICLTDILATIAAVVGVRLPDDAGEDSYNILPALRGDKLDRPIREAIVHSSGDGTLAIRQGPWKLALARGSHGFSAPRTIQPKAGEAQGQLYNLDDDPREQKNLWLEKPEIVKRLTALLEKYKREGRSCPR